jgi:transitional endoplasmic reticulum ATPase
MTNLKPLLYNGYKLPDGSVIVGREERIYFTEVYKLDNNKYLYLFLKQKIEDIPSVRLKSQLITIRIGAEIYIGLVSDQFNAQFVSDFQHKMSNLTGFDAVAGMEELKTMLTNEVIEPLQHPEKFQKFKLSIPNGVLLFGPPGCGKTFIVRKLAEELGYFFVEIKHSDVGSMYIHETSSKIAKQFENARAHAPAILFIDEISALVPKRDLLDSTSQYKEEEVDEFLMQLEHASDQNILVVGATNFPNKIDPAIRRSGRMDKIIFVPPPDLVAREQLLRIYLTGRPFDNSIDFKKLAKKTDGYVSSDIELIVTQAARLALSNDLPKIDEKILEAAITQSSPSLTQEEISDYEKYKNLERR